jgi:hypothetical protein
MRYAVQIVAMSAPVTPRPETSLVPFDRGPGAVDDLASQLLWLAIQQRPWRTLAVVGASPGVATIETANMLAKLAWWYRGQPSSVADFRDLSLRLVDHQLRDVAHQVERHPIAIVIALRSIFENPTVIPVASAVDAAVLCVHMNATKITSARETIAAIGKDKFLGTIVLRDAAPGAGRNHP